MTKRAFTLLELLVVIALMGFLGTVAVGGYRAMRRGMEDRGAVDDANQFIRAAYQRAQIDRAPVAVYFWNETLQAEDSDKTAIAVGKAIAVRRSGRFSMVDGNYLYDEFSDLIVDSGDAGGDDPVTSAQTASGSGVFVYKLNGAETSPQRSVVYEVPAVKKLSLRLARNDARTMLCYAYEMKDRNGVSWRAGDAYGFEFASIQLPHGYIFGSQWNKSAGGVTQPESMLFSVGANSGSGAQNGTTGRSTVTLYSLRPDSSGSISAQKVGTTTSPTQDVSE